MSTPSIRSYLEAAAYLGESPSKGTNQRATRVVRLSDTAISIRYHNTDVVTFYHPDSPEGKAGHVATIRMGGFATPTTVDRINRHAPEGVTADLLGDAVRVLYFDAAGDVIDSEHMQGPSDLFRVHTQEALSG